MPNTGPTRIAVGIMTGTSLDGIDACALQLRGRGLDMTADHLGFASIPLGELADPLRALAEDEPMPASMIAHLRRRLGECCGDAIDALALQDGIDLVAVHGQTVHHAPPESWQLIDPFPIAQRFQARVASDLRGLDRATGGQGAPITPLADWILHRDDAEQVIVNLGGFINCTVLPGREQDDPLAAIRGFDVCPCNHLLDTVARLALEKPYDDGGALAMSGNACLEQLELISHHLKAMNAESRSLGSGDECIEFVPDVLQGIGPADAAATFCAAIASTLDSALSTCSAEAMLLAGGGTRNAALVGAISERIGDRMTVGRLDHGDEREAASMAVLGALAEDGVPITLHAVTGRGATGARDGCWVEPGRPTPSA
jgi:1,6-anhydro-N-acetylmuramate kinase